MAAPARCLHRLFERQAAAIPEATAVVCGSRRLTYGELDRHAAGVARELTALGQGPERVVGLSFERSLEFVVALLGVLKAGAAYLPLDPEHPPARVAFVLDDAGVDVVLTTEPLRALLPPGRARVICIDATDEPPPADEPPVGADAVSDNLAYVMYTSGSTGAPKGVLCCHRGAVAHVELMRSLVRATPEDAVLQVASYGFDASVREVFVALASGAHLVVAPFGLRDPAQVAETLDEQAITIVPSLVPSALPPLLDELRGRGPCRARARVAAISGEPLPPRLAAEVGEVLASEVYSLYGPTEGTLAASHHRCSPADRSKPVTPLGRSNPGERLTVVDRDGGLAPVGAAGELWLGGVGVARGYVGSPRLTAERFVPDPFGGVAGARCYRTGDLAHVDGDGALEFLGRVDEQVKVRGIRVEPAEVEAALTAEGAARAAAVIAFGPDLDRRLVAYVVPASPSPGEADVHRLRAHARKRLPAALIPDELVFVDRLPLTASGKVDRRRLSSDTR